MSRIMVVFWCALTLATSVVRAQVEATPVEPAVACSGVCHQLFGRDEDKLALCLEGCAAGQKCIARCDEMTADEEKRARCHYRCARAD